MGGESRDSPLLFGGISMAISVGDRCCACDRGTPVARFNLNKVAAPKMRHFRRPLRTVPREFTRPAWEFWLFRGPSRSTRSAVAKILKTTSGRSLACDRRSSDSARRGPQV
jgi:hypothetical protein